MRYINGNNGQTAVAQPRPIRLKNIASNQMTVDTLFRKAKPLMACTQQLCSGSLMRQTKQDLGKLDSILKNRKGDGKCPVVHTQELKSPYRSKEEILTDAYQFMEQYFDSIKRLNTIDHQDRLGQIKYEVRTTGTYNLKQDELLFGAKQAWRNASRCIGRIQWTKLQLFDARNIKTAKEMFERICNHIRCATNNGNIKSTITIFPQRVVGREDFRLWNQQLVAYAGYESKPETSEVYDHSTSTTKCPIVGDSSNVEFTRICQKLGWRGKGTQFDVLPIVVNVPGEDPEWFEIPEDIILRVQLEHPQFDWFKKLGLQWYALPAVSGMKFDVGGIEFPATPFSGWYMDTEIAVRDLCDTQRYNILPVMAERMGLDTSSNVSLWKDRAVLEVNTAVLHSFQKMKVTIVDHYTASESFMIHLENENRLRGGCPADWVWIVPPVSGSLLPVYHQEMLNYELKPTYQYQEPAWKVHSWKKANPLMSGGRVKNFTFREVVHSVRFTANLFARALAKRVKATIVYATETGKSELFARRLAQIFSYAFNVSVVCMDNYDIMKLEHESLLLLVTSTFGNGDSPDNGKPFFKQIQALAKATGHVSTPSAVGTSKFSFSHTNGEHGLLKSVRFGVFALGSKAYPQFCAFGRFLDGVLAELGGQRFTKLGTGDELAGQEQSFSEWTAEAFKQACESFELTNKVDMGSVLKRIIQKAAKWSRKSVKLEPIYMEIDEVAEKSRIKEAHARNSNKKILRYKLMEREVLNKPLNGKDDDEKAQTIRIALQTDIRQQANVNKDFDKSDAYYQPGDHLAIYPSNDTNLVKELIARLLVDTNNTTNQQYVIRTNNNNGTNDDDKWSLDDRLPSPISLREALNRYLDITTPPSQKFLELCTDFANSQKEATRLKQLANDQEAYETWKEKYYPNLLEVLNEFPSVRLPLELIFTQVPLMQPRFYSISSSPLANSTIRIDLTVSLVQYQTAAGQQHYGVCSNFFNKVALGHNIYGFIRHAPNFHLPKETNVPLIMVGPGTGIAPFRGFWQHRKMLASIKSPSAASTNGKMKLFFGCRSPSMQLYKTEIESAVKEGAISNYIVAFSRKQGEPKKYVQDAMAKLSKQIYNDLIEQNGHIYICGDVTMADDVKKTLKVIFEENGSPDGQAVIESLKESQHYHEDIFGVVLRTTEMIKHEA